MERNANAYRQSQSASGPAGRAGAGKADAVSEVASGWVAGKAMTGSAPPSAGSASAGTAECRRHAGLAKELQVRSDCQHLLARAAG